MTAGEKYKVRDELFYCLHDHKRSLDKSDRYTDYGMGFSEAMKIVAMYIFDDDNPITNGDKIRAMTDEELADWLVLVEMRIRQLQPMLEIPALKKDWLSWLRQEADK